MFSAHDTDTSVKYQQQWRRMWNIVMDVMNTNKVEYLHYHPFPHKMHLVEKLKIDGLSRYCPIGVDKKTIMLAFLFETVTTFLLSVFGIQRKHGVKSLEHYRLETQKKKNKQQKTENTNEASALLCKIRTISLIGAIDL